MTRYVITPDVGLRLARDGVKIPAKHRLLAPKVFLSQAWSLLYELGREGRTSRAEARRHLDYLRKLRMRLLGDHVLQDHAWKIAEQLGWPDTFDAEYVALTRLQADALVTLDTKLARAVKGVVMTVPIDELY